MKFYLSPFKGHEQFFPKVPRTAPIPELSEPYTCIELPGRRTKVLTSILRMALEFNRTAEYRMEEGQDCTAFALACVTDDPLYGKDWRLQPGGSKLEVKRDLRPITEVDIDTFASIGDIVFSGIPASDPERRALHAHVQVLATPPSEPPLYFSKWGVGSLVGAHTLETTVNGLYPATHVGIVEEISVTPFLLQSA